MRTLHGYRTIADIMRALNPFTGAFYLEALQMSRMTREMFCLMEGRHVHPSTLYPGGVGTVPTVQLFTDYIVRLMKYVEFMKKVVPLHDDLFDFFYEALPGYEEVGRRRILLGCWGSFNDPEHCDYTYKNMTNWGRKMFVTPGVVVDGELVTTDLVDINLNIRILLGSSYYDDWQDGQTFVKHDPLGNPVDQRHPWNQTTTPRPQKRDFKEKYTWVMSPRWFDKRTGDHLALDTGGGPIARFWATALAGIVDIGYIKATGKSVKIYLPKTASKPEVEFEWKIPKWSNAIERDRARTYFQAYAAAAALALRRAGSQGTACGQDAHVVGLQGARRSHRLRLPRGRSRRAFASRGDQERQDRQLSSLSAHAVERQPARFLRHAGALRRRRAEHADLRGKRPGQVQRHRHHARGPQLRSLSSLRRAHVRWRRQDPGDSPFADVRLQRLTTMPIPAEFQQRLESIERLLGEVESEADPSLRATVQELVQTVMDLHGAGLERMLELIRASGDGGESIIHKLGRDELVSSCWSCTGFIRWISKRELRRPWIRQARACARTKGRSELLSIRDGAVRVAAPRQWAQNSNGCGSTAQALKEMVEEAVYRSAPDIDGTGH